MKNKNLVTGAIIGVIAVVAVVVAVFAFGSAQPAQQQTAQQPAGGQSSEPAAPESAQREHAEGFVWAVSKSTQLYEGGMEITASYSYDDAGHLVKTKHSSTDEEMTEMIGEGQVFTYDDAGRLASVGTRFADYDELFNPIRYTYDDAGRCVEYSEVENWEGDAGSVTTYTYDDKGRVASATSKGSTSAVVDGVADTVYEYTYSYTDDEGLTGSVHEEGTVLSAPGEDEDAEDAEYGEDDDAEGFDTPSQATYAIKDGRVVFEEAEKATYEYDDYGNLVRESYESDETGSITFTYEYKQIKVDLATYKPNYYTNPSIRVYEGSTHFPPVLTQGETAKVLDAATEESLKK